MEGGGGMGGKTPLPVPARSPPGDTGSPHGVVRSGKDRGSSEQ